MDKLSQKQRSENMRRIKSADTKPELIVRRALFKLGYRYRLHGKNLPGKPDIIFSQKNKIIFVHGCFWHQHASTKCLDARMPKSNKKYWKPKLQMNAARDRKNRLELKKSGWKILVIWECQTIDLVKLNQKLTKFLECE